MEEVRSAAQNPLLAEKHRALEEFLRRLKEQAVWQRIAKVVLYGSVLRGDAGEESDIDVLLVVQQTYARWKKWPATSLFLYCWISASGWSLWFIAWKTFTPLVLSCWQCAREERRSTACQKHSSSDGRPKTF
jgi:hypothetical protein